MFLEKQFVIMDFLYEYFRLKDLCHGFLTLRVISRSFVWKVILHINKNWPNQYPHWTWGQRGMGNKEDLPHSLCPIKIFPLSPDQSQMFPVSLNLSLLYYINTINIPPLLINPLLLRAHMDLTHKVRSLAKYEPYQYQNTFH